MFLIGRYQSLTVDHFSDAGAYLKEAAGTDTVLLPGGQLPEGVKIGDEISVFLYKDSEDRPIATTRKPALQLGEIGALTVKQLSHIGAFLDWGLAKDLFLPFKEMSGSPQPGQKVCVRLYLDRSERLAATMRIEKVLETPSPYRFNDQVKGIVYSVNPDMGAFVAVEGRYFGLIPRQELFERLTVGQTVEARVTRVRPDGKLNLAIRKKAYAQMEEDAARILAHLKEAGGILGVGDKSDAALIQTELSMSKNAFKRAAGSLLKAGRIRIGEDQIQLIENAPQPGE